MRTLQISDQKARSIYKTGDAELKAILEESFGKDFFKGDIRDRVKSYEDALKVLGRADWVKISISVILKFGGYISDDIIAYMKLCIIVEALNEGWKPNWDDVKNYKYRPWFCMHPSSFAFNDSHFECTYARAGSGSRLCLKSEELSDYCGKQFIDLWKEFML